MTDIAIIIAYFVLPLSSLLIYIKLVRRMKAEGVFNPPVFSLFLVMLSYTLLLFMFMSIFTSLYVPSNLPLLYLNVIIGPILMFISACTISYKRDFSAYHNGVYLASLTYIIVLFLLYGVLLFLIIS